MPISSRSVKFVIKQCLDRAEADPNIVVDKNLAEAIIEEFNLKIPDPRLLAKEILSIMKDNQELVEKIRAGQTGCKNVLMKKVMDKFPGAVPADVVTLIDVAIDERFDQR